VGDFYQRDKLVKGKVKLRGHEVDLSNVGCSVLNVSGKWDYAVPPCQTKATSALACGPDQESITLEAGHVGMLVGPGTWAASGRVFGIGSCRARANRGNEQKS